MIEKLFKGKYTVQILKLIDSIEEGTTISDVSKELGISKSVVFKTLKQLEYENIINSVSKGKRRLFMINVENFFVRRIVKGFLEVEKNSIEEVRELIKKKFKSIPIISLILYGSFDTPRFDFKSDIDLLIISDKNVKNLIEKIVKDFEDKGILLFIDVMTSHEFKRLYKIKEPLIENIIKNSVTLLGKHPMELIK